MVVLIRRTVLNINYSYSFDHVIYESSERKPKRLSTLLQECLD